MSLLVASIRTGTADAHITQTIPIPKHSPTARTTQFHQRGRPHMLVTYISPAERLPRCYLCYASSSRLPFCLLWWNARPFPVRQRIMSIGGVDPLWKPTTIDTDTPQNVMLRLLIPDSRHHTYCDATSRTALHPSPKMTTIAQHSAPGPFRPRDTVIIQETIGYTRGEP
ncbi:hypothetical protein EDB85DRAFT_1906524 [Lactarius pseudohatsudake]|nr:hypothetical protein EDB85DRAFT_1906524 [Lactarius pseudohatsudake]